MTLTVEEAANILGISRNTAYEAARLGKIPVIKIGRRLLVPKPALMRMLQEVEGQVDLIGATDGVAEKQMKGGDRSNG